MDPSFTADDFSPRFGGQALIGQYPIVQGGAKRGVAWVLRWAAASGVLFFSTAVLAEYAFCLAAELTLVRAARAGALEATLPRATQRSVAETVGRRLKSLPLATGRWRLAIRQNDQPILGPLTLRPGDRLTVSITIPRRGALPRWLSSLKFWGGNERIVTQAERRIPGRQIHSSGRRPA